MFGDLYYEKPKILGSTHVKRNEVRQSEGSVRILFELLQRRGSFVVSIKNQSTLRTRETSHLYRLYIVDQNFTAKVVFNI